MQCLSHKTRAYFVNADCLKGFLCHSLVSEVLRRNQKNKAFEEATKYQKVDLQAVMATLDGMSSNEKRLEYLG